MQDTTRLKQAALERLNRLNNPKLRQVVDFMDFLLERPASLVEEPKAPLGSMQDLLAIAGTWEFEAGELEEILQEIEHSRLMELEDSHGSLLA